MSKTSIKLREQKRNRKAIKTIDSSVMGWIERQRKAEGAQAYALRQAMLQRQLTVNLGGLYRDR